MPAGAGAGGQSDDALSPALSVNTTIAIDFDRFIDVDSTSSIRVEKFDTASCYFSACLINSSTGGSRYSDHAYYTTTSPTGMITKLRFKYVRGTGAAYGTNRVWIDNLRIRRTSDGVLLVNEKFDTLGALPTGFTISPSDAWKAERPFKTRAMGPPDSQPVRQPLNTTTYVNRSVSFGSASVTKRCTFKYYYDAGVGSKMRFFLGSTEYWSLDSGGEKSGSVEAIFPNTTTTGWIYFDFKRVAPGGNDVVRVYDIACYGAVGGKSRLRWHFNFDGETVNVASAGVVPNGWSGGCVSNGGSCTGVGAWVVQNASMQKVYVPMQTPTETPVIDGMSKNNEYNVLINGQAVKNVTPLPFIENWATSGPNAGETGDVQLFASSNKLYIVARIPSSTTALGSEDGSISMFIDSGRNATLSRSTTECSPDHRRAGENDRRIDFSYALGAGVQSQTISTFTHHQGACNGVVTAATSSPWGSPTAVVHEEDGGLSVEMRIDLATQPGTTILNEGKLGLYFLFYEASYARQYQSGGDNGSRWEDSSGYFGVIPATVLLQALPTGGPIENEIALPAAYPAFDPSY